MRSDIHSRHRNVVAVSAAQFTRRQYKPGSLALPLCIFSALFDVPATVFGVAIPTILPLFIFIFLISKLRALAFHAFPYVLGWFVLFIFSELLSPATTTANLGTFVVQSIFSIFCSVAAYLLVKQHSAGDILKWSTRLTWLLFLIGVLERFTPIGSIILDLNGLLYSSETGFQFSMSEESLERDIALAGGRRATMLMAEPSLAAIAVITLLALRTITSTRSTFVVHIIILAVAYFLIRSPILMLGLVFQLSFTVAKSNTSRSTIIRIVLIAAASAGIALLIFANRLHNFDLNTPYVTSEGLRLLLPALLLFKTMDQGLFFGIGPSGLYDKDLIWAISGGVTDTIGTNALLGFFICFGPILPLIFFGVLIARGSRSNQQLLPFLLFVALMSMTVGAFMAPKTWLIPGVFLGALAAQPLK